MVQGEGEQALLTLITRLERGEPIADIPRVLSLHHTEVAPMKELRPLLRMNTLAEPDFGEMSLASYRSIDGSHGVRNSPVIAPVLWIWALARCSS